MNYYPHHIGDFLKDTNFLSNEEQMIYLKLIWLYYDTEQPLPDDVFTLSMKANCRDKEEELRGILSMFFKNENGKWRHTRCDDEIARYHGILSERSKAGKASAAKRALSATSTSVEQVLNVRATNNQQSSTNQEPRTKNKEPKEKIRGATATRLPADWYPSDDDFSFCRNERPDLTPIEVASRFRDYWIAQPGTKGRKTDWPATWRNWVRNEKKINGSQYQTAKQATDTAQLRAIGWTAEMTQAIKDSQQGKLIEGTML